jgi:hypothetical protein
MIAAVRGMFIVRMAIMRMRSIGGPRAAVCHESPSMRLMSFG